MYAAKFIFSFFISICPLIAFSAVIEWVPERDVKLVEFFSRSSEGESFKRVKKYNLESRILKYQFPTENVKEIFVLGRNDSGHIVDAAWSKTKVDQGNVPLQLTSALKIDPLINSVSDTDRINSSLLLASRLKKVVLFRAGVYFISGKSGVVIPSGATIFFDDEATFNYETSSYPSYQIIGIYDSEDIRLIGGHLVGDRDSRSDSVGEWGMCLKIIRSSRVYVQDLRAEKCWGDGIYIGFDGGGNSDILFESVKAFSNRRNGLTIVGGERVVVSNSLFERNGGVSPGAGIDVEPNRKSDCLNYVELRNIDTRHNSGAGIQIGLGKLEIASRSFDIAVKNHNDIGSYRGLLLSNSNGRGLLRINGGAWDGQGRRVEVRGKALNSWIKYDPENGAESPWLKMYR